ncbi:MAG: phytanoyl-CoA dioxygenase family protein [Bryobacteraceae bacterium]|nr:phytanoyl-CoA dioxygenase family protein [Bryobacteraceae bacterium]
MVALRLHLDECSEHNGSLRVLPGTHRSGRLDREQNRTACYMCRPKRRGIAPDSLSAANSYISLLSSMEVFTGRGAECIGKCRAGLETLCRRGRPPHALLYCNFDLL